MLPSMLPSILSLCILEQLEQLEHEEREERRLRRFTIRHNGNNKMKLPEILSVLPEDTFMAHFGFPKAGVQKIIDAIQSFDDKSLPDIPFKVQVLITLNFLRSGKYEFSAGYISQPLILLCIDKICTLIVLHIGNMCIKFPTTAQDVQIKRQGFMKYNLPNVVGVVGCMHAAIQKPPNPEEYWKFYNRQHFFSINVEASCDSDLLFLHVSTKYAGSTTDDWIWRNSAAGDYLARDWKTEEPIFLLAGRQYHQLFGLLTPYPKPTKDFEVAYNAKQIPARSLIDQAFDALKSIFKCISSDRPLRLPPLKAVRIINTCFSLYNFMKINNYHPFTETQNNGVPQNVDEVQNITLFDPKGNVRDQYARKFFDRNQL